MILRHKWDTIELVKTKDFFWMGRPNHFYWRRWNLSKALKMDEVFNRHKKREIKGKMYSHDKGMMVGMYTLKK